MFRLILQRLKGKSAFETGQSLVLQYLARMDRFRLFSFGVCVGLFWLVMLLGYYSQLPGWRSLDFLVTTGQIERALARWSAEDVAYHLWGIRTLDTVFPALYGIVLTTVSIRYWQGWKRSGMIALVWITVLADYIENAYSIRLLNGGDGITPHLWATWIKLTAITPPMNLGLMYWWREVRERRSAR